MGSTSDHSAFKNDDSSAAYADWTSVGTCGDPRLPLAQRVWWRADHEPGEEAAIKRAFDSHDLA